MTIRVPCLLVVVHVPAVARFRLQGSLPSSGRSPRRKLPRSTPRGCKSRDISNYQSRLVAGGGLAAETAGGATASARPRRSHLGVCHGAYCTRRPSGTPATYEAMTLDRRAEFGRSLLSVLLSLPTGELYMSAFSLSCILAALVFVTS